MGDWGIKISKEGYDVKTASDNQLIFSSAFNNWKVHASGTVNLILDGENSNYVDIYHSLEYVPTAMAFLVWGDISSKLPFFYVINEDMGMYVYFDLYISASSIRIWGMDTWGGDTYPLKYYIFKEKII